MDVNEKIKLFEMSCQKLVRKDAAELNKMIDDEIEHQIEHELQEYQDKEEFTYHKKIEKMEKDYNKQIYALEMENKKAILNEKKNIQKEIQKEVTKILKDFTNTAEYRTFLMQKIEEAMGKLEQKNDATVGILKKDNEKFGSEIQNKYQINISMIEDKYIGGCIIENRLEGIYIDNTIQNSINEKLENESG